MDLQSHLEERSGWQMEEAVDRRVVKILDQYRLHDSLDRDTVQRICGIFDTNAFDLMSGHDGGGAVDITGVFPAAAMLMHSCVKNTRIVFEYV